MTPRLWLELGLVAVAALLGFLLTSTARAKAKAEGAALVFHVQLGAALDSLDVSRDRQALADAERAEVDRTAAAEIAAANARRIQAEARSDAAAARRPEVIARVIREAGVDSAVVRVAVTEVADSIVAHEVVPLRVALAEASRVIAAKDAQLAARDAQIEARDLVAANLASALTASKSESASLRRALPGWFGRNGSKLLLPAAVAAGWVLRDRLGS